MKTIWRIFIRDLKKIFTNSMAIILAAGVLVLPSLYAWVNIYANWDPYGKQSTGNMQIAVMIEDKGYSFRGLDVNVGAQIRENLRANDVIDWQFVSQTVGLNGVKSGKYYAAIYIPENFSESLVSIVSSDFELPQITYYANEKKNAIATKITDKVVQTVQGEVNESFIKTIADVVNKVLVTLLPDAFGEEPTAETLAKDITLVKTNITELQKTISGFGTVMTLSQKVSAAIPEDTMKQLTQDLSGTLKSTQDAIKVTSSAVESLVSFVEPVISQSQEDLNDASEMLGGVKNILNNSSGDIKKAKNIVSNHLENITALRNALENIGGAVPSNGMNPLIDRLDGIISQLSAVEKTMEAAESGGEKIDAEKISGQLSAIADAMGDAGEEYNNTVKPALKASLQGMSDVLGDLLNVISALDNNKDLSELMKTLDTSAATGIGILNQLDTMLSGFISKLDKLSALISGMNDSEVVNVLYNLMVNNGSELGAFLSSPVNIDTDTIYGIENYGSAMAPFYTTLAIWVGGIILVAIFKTNVKNKKELGNVNPVQEYFGRGLTFVSFALVQGIIICLGDLYFLKIQCLHPALFILAGAVASLIFSFFIYSVTVAFGDIGKAVIVILLVIQLGGSGGTFPIDVTPAFFRVINPYLPFTFIINAMRECVCESWGFDYWFDLIGLCAYIPVALIFGIVIHAILRKPIKFFTKKIEETGLL